MSLCPDSDFIFLSSFNVIFKYQLQIQNNIYTGIFSCNREMIRIIV